jgi:hypothetical protein
MAPTLGVTHVFAPLGKLGRHPFLHGPGPQDGPDPPLGQLHDFLHPWPEQRQPWEDDTGQRPDFTRSRRFRAPFLHRFLDLGQDQLV